MDSVNTSIKCRVSSCKHHDKNEYCQLNDITVGGSSNAKECDDTQCKSFECDSCL
ncbi:MAG: DUF1540 domain-containing protein [Firmicutes bacterium]|nr:DUF1540 domain-containing protein [Bacillota bacterium]